MPAIECRICQQQFGRAALDHRAKQVGGREVLHGLGDDGSREEIVIWIERRPGALWAVGRAIDLRNRSNPAPRTDDYIFEGYELEDALEAANATLEDDVSVLERDGKDLHVAPFKRQEVLKPLERWFFGHVP